MTNYIRASRDSIRYEGFPIFLWRIIVNILAPVVMLDHQILFEIDLTKPIQQRRARVDCRIEPATEADLEKIVEMVFPPLPAYDPEALSDAEEYEHALYERQCANYRELFHRNARRWLRAGEMCFVARIGDEIAHSNWIRFDWCGQATQRPIRLQPGEVYTTEGHTAKHWRGKAIHEAVLSHMLRYAQGRGCRKAYTITDLVKAGSRRGVLRVGWTQRGHHMFITPRWLNRTWIVRLGGDVEPVLRQIFEEAGRP